MTTQPKDRDTVVILHNPRAGRRPSGKRVEQLQEALRQRGFSVQISQDLSQAVDLANSLYDRGSLRCFVGAGGDGTAGELINRVLPGVPLTFFPTGTSNLLAGYLGYSRNPEKVVEVISKGEIVALDAGVANQRLFLVMASCGFDAAAVEMVHRRRMSGHRGGRGGFAGFIGPICRLCMNYPFPEMKVTIFEKSAPTAGGIPDHSDVIESNLFAKWVFIFNLPRYGWGLPIAPHSVGNDGLLDLCTYRRGGFWRGLWYTAVTQLSLHRRLADFHHLRGTRFRITAETPVPYQLDGDPGGYLPLEVEVAPARVKVLVAPRIACSLRLRSNVFAEEVKA